MALIEPTLTQLRAFEATFRLKSITAAAHELAYSQSAVSRQVKGLEDNLGAVLFARSDAGMEPTESANVLYDHVSILLARLERAVSDVGTIQAGESRGLIIGSPPSINSDVLPLTIARLSSSNKIGSIVVHEGTTSDIITRIQRSELDLGIITHYPLMGSLDISGIRYVKIFSEALLCAMPVHHPLAQLRSVEMEALADIQWIESYDPTKEVLTKACHIAGYEPRIDIRCSGWMSKLGFVAAGLGFTLVPQVLSRLRKDKITVRPFRDPIHRDLYVCLARKEPSSLLVGGFITFVREALIDVTSADQS